MNRFVAALAIAIACSVSNAAEISVLASRGGKWDFSAQGSASDFWGNASIGAMRSKGVNGLLEARGQFFFAPDWEWVARRDSMGSTRGSAKLSAKGGLNISRLSNFAQGASVSHEENAGSATARGIMITWTPLRAHVDQGRVSWEAGRIKLEGTLDLSGVPLRAQPFLPSSPISAGSRELSWEAGERRIPQGALSHETEVLDERWVAGWSLESTTLAAQRRFGITDKLSLALGVGASMKILGGEVEDPTNGEIRHARAKGALPLARGSARYKNDVMMIELSGEGIKSANARFTEIELRGKRLITTVGQVKVSIEGRARETKAIWRKDGAGDSESSEVGARIRGRAYFLGLNAEY